MRVSQNEFSTPKKCKEFLTEAGIEFKDDEELTQLTKKCMKRKRHLEKETNTPDAQRALFQTHVPRRDIKEVKSILTSYRSGGFAEKKFIPNAVGILDDVSPDVVKLKHDIGANATCRGNVVGGECMRCHCNTPGVFGYAFDIKFCDTNNKECKLVLKGSESAGNTLFKMSATDFALLKDDVKADVIDGIIYEKFNFGIFAKVEGDDELAVAYGLAMQAEVD